MNVVGELHCVKLQGFTDKRRRKKDNKICTKFLFDIQNSGNKLNQKTTIYRNLTLQIFGDSTITTPRNGNFNMTQGNDNFNSTEFTNKGTTNIPHDKHTLITLTR